MIKKNNLSILELIFLAFLSIPQIIIILLKNFKNILYGDSFYAESLRLFYLRIYKISMGKNLYINRLSKIRPESFIYHNFGAIILCYKIIGRPFYVLISHTIFISYIFNFFVIEDALVLSLVYLFSSVFYFNQIDRGNYNFMGIIISLIAVHYYSISGLNINFLLICVLTIFFSISAFVLLFLVINFQLLINNNLQEFYSIFFIGGIILFLFLMLNIFFLKLKNKNFRFEKIFQGIYLTLSSIGFFRINGGKKNFLKNTKRKTTFFFAFLSILPFLFAAVIDKEILSPIFFILISIIYLNQSKIIRIFDFYFIYTWSFCYILLNSGISSWTEILALIIIGTNPIYIYAMDNYNFSLKRGFKILPPCFLNKKERKKILNKIIKILPKGNLIIVPLNQKIKEYNDLWRYESLVLEWIWTASENKKIKFFPDYFSIFNVSNLRYNFNNIEKLSKITNSKTLSFKKIVKNKTNKEIQMYKIKQIFRNELLERYCPKIQKYFFLIR
jgi:hypothetical protein